MSLHWSFAAFPTGTFARVFGSSGPAEVAEFLSVIEWAGTDGGADWDIAATQALARSALTEELNYSGRSSSTAGHLDSIVALALSPEGKGALGLSELHRGGTDGPDHIWARFGIRQQAVVGRSILDWLEQGRRWRTSEPCASVLGAYLVFAPNEVAELLAELRGVVARGGAAPGYVEDVEAFVLPELESFVSAQFELVGLSG